MNDLRHFARNLRYALHHAGRYGLVHFCPFCCQSSMLCGKCRNNRLNHLRHFPRDTAQPVYNAFGNAGGHIYAYLRKLGGLRRHCVYHLLHNGCYRTVQRGHIGNNPIVYGAHGFFCGHCSRAPHCALHICGNAVHAVAKAHAYAFAHICSDFSEYR